MYLDFIFDLFVKCGVKRNVNRLGLGIMCYWFKLIEDVYGNIGNVISVYIIWYNS